MPNPVPMPHLDDLVPQAYQVIRLRKIYTLFLEPCAIELILNVEINGTDQNIKLVIEPGTMAGLGYENPGEVFLEKFNQIPDIEYNEPVLAAAQNFLVESPNQLQLSKIICDTVI